MHLRFLQIYPRRVPNSGQENPSLEASNPTASASPILCPAAPLPPYRRAHVSGTGVTRPYPAVVGGGRSGPRGAVGVRGALVKLAVYGALGLGGRPEGDAVKIALSVLNMFVFAWLESVTGGASYNPLTVLAATLASGGGPTVYLSIAFVRIPAEVIGAVLGVNLIQYAFPEVGKGARLSVGVHHGVLAEGLASFLVVMVSVTLKKEMKGFFMKTWITSIWKNTLHILSSDISGGIMNPASAFAWAYARGDHSTFEHLLVYWLAPLQATLLGVWVVTFLTKPKKIEEQDADKNKTKKE